jgi:hypothetical protein
VAAARRDPTHPRRERFGLLEVGGPGGIAACIERDQVAERRQRALKFPPELPVPAEQQDLHATRRS